MRAHPVLLLFIAGAFLASFPPALRAGEPNRGDLPGRAGTRDIVCPESGVPGSLESTDALPPGFVDCNDNSIPDECDIQWGTSHDCNLDVIPDECQVLPCELDDGVHLIALETNDLVTWFPERGFNSFNLYRGDLDLLKTAGLYTQDPATVPLAARTCHFRAVSLADGMTPPLGEVIYYLLTGNTGPLEGPLSDGAGPVRPNDNPCPPPPDLSVSVRTDRVVYAPGEAVQITIDVANIGSTSVIALQFPTTCQANFRIEDLSGAPIYVNVPACFFIFTQLVLQPGQTASFPYSWSQLDGSGLPLNLSGEYVVRGVLLNQVPEPSGITGIAIAP